MKVVIACDSFKGSLSSPEVAEAASSGILSVSPDAEIAAFPVADGGEGTADALIQSLKARREVCTVHDPLGRLVSASYGMFESAQGKTAVMDVASACGLTLVEPELRDVTRLTTHGVGDLIKEAYGRGCRRFVVGLGGSGTCDGGRGLLQSLDEIESEDVKRDIFRCLFTVLSDVTNPLLGPEGAARVFAPQKGASPMQVEALEHKMSEWACRVAGQTGHDFRNYPGAGAAGGLGFAFLSFFNSEMLSGAEAVLDIIGFEKALEGADFVITGEGCIDAQTLGGKLPMAVCRRARAKGIPTIAIAGIVKDKDELMQAGFAAICQLPRLTATVEEAMLPVNARRAVAKAVADLPVLAGLSDSTDRSD